MLNTAAHMASYDDYYEALLTAHQGLSTEESHALNARLVLLLSNHIGDLDVIKAALRVARGRADEQESASHAGVAAVTPVVPSHATPQ